MRRRIPAQRASVLGSVPLFRGCDAADLTQVDALADEIEVGSGETLTREGHTGRESFVILEGEASVVLRGHSIARLGAGDCFGEMALLTPGCPRSATVVALTPMRLLVFEPRAFSSLIDIPTVARRVLATMVERLRASQNQNHDLAPTP